MPEYRLWETIPPEVNAALRVAPSTVEASTVPMSVTLAGMVYRCTRSVVAEVTWRQPNPRTDDLVKLRNAVAKQMGRRGWYSTCLRHP